jgi:polygalacturonase
MIDRNRREFLKRGAAAVGASVLLPGFRDVSATGWEQVPEILKRVVQPAFPARDFDIPKYGAAGDGVKDCSAAFADAIEACKVAGGGRVTVPPGRYLTGPIHLRSGVNLHVEDGATIGFSTDPGQYLPPVRTRFEGVELMGLSPLIYAIDCENIAVTGAGTLDGQASHAHWWPLSGTRTEQQSRRRLTGMVGQGVAVAQRVFGAQDGLRPSLIQFYRCKNVVIGRFSDRADGVTIERPPLSALHLVLCTNVTVRRVHVSSPGSGNDGCDLESCKDVLIENTSFDTAAGCITIKHGPSENIIVRGCEMRDGHDGVTIDSDESGGARNVFVERCTMNSPRLDRGLRLTTNAARGALLEHIYMRDVSVREAADAVVSIDGPVVRDVEVLRVTSKKSNYGVAIRGPKQSTIDDVRLIDCTFDGVSKGNAVQRANAVHFQNTRMNGELVR